MIEVAEDNVNTLVLFTQQIFDWDLDVVESDVGRSCRWRVGCLDGPGLDTFTSLDEYDAQTLLCLYSRDKIIAPNAVGDPFLGSVHNLCVVKGRLASGEIHATYIILPVGSFLGGSSQTGDIRASEGLSDG